MYMMVSFVLSFFPRDVLDEILNLIESVSEDFPSYSCRIIYTSKIKQSVRSFAITCLIPFFSVCRLNTGLESALI